MKLFSRRFGYTSQKKIQLESMDQDLKTGLWNVLHQHFWEHYEVDGFGDPIPDRYLTPVFKDMWMRYYKWPITYLPRRWDTALQKISESYSTAVWYEIYDLIQFLHSHADGVVWGGSDAFAEACNRVLEEENSGYRLVDGLIVPITNETDMTEIESAAASPYDAVASQIRSALQKLADKKNPDYRNCIKDSIGAVETAVRLASGDEKGTLGKLLPKLKDKLDLHPSQVDGYSKLYGYTSDDGAGIRHGMMDKDNLTSDDARYMLVTCSAFANYLLRLAERAELKPGRSLSKRYRR